MAESSQSPRLTTQQGEASGKLDRGLTMTQGPGRAKAGDICLNMQLLVLVPALLVYSIFILLIIYYNMMVFLFYKINRINHFDVLK